MVLHPITIEVPERMLDQLRKRASGAQRSVEQEAFSALSTKLTDDELEFSRIESALSKMDSYSTEQLMDVAKVWLSRANCDRSQELNDKQREEGLTPAERIELETLLTQYQWHVLLRAKALALLKQRDCDLGPFLQPPANYWE